MLDVRAAVLICCTLPVDVVPLTYDAGMRYLMLMWADADAASGDESDFQAWADFDEQVKTAGVFVLNGALTPASASARLVQTAIAGRQPAPNGGYMCADIVDLDRTRFGGHPA